MKITALSTLATLIAAPALAGGLNAPAPELFVAAPAPVIARAFGSDWTGAYVGLRLGYGDTGSSGDVDGNGVIDAVDNALLDASGAVGGITAGYMYDFGSYVLGAELGLNATDIDFDAGNGSVDTLHTLKLKAGYDAGRTLIFGTLGAAYSDGSFGGVAYDDTGYVIGAGVEYLLTDSLSIGGELNYHRFDDVDGTGVDLDMTTISATMNYRF